MRLFKYIVYELVYLFSCMKQHHNSSHPISDELRPSWLRHRHSCQINCEMLGSTDVYAVPLGGSMENM